VADEFPAWGNAVFEAVAGFLTVGTGSSFSTLVLGEQSRWPLRIDTSVPDEVLFAVNSVD
jgi:hypothetical protein